MTLYSKRVRRPSGGVHARTEGCGQACTSITSSFAFTLIAALALALMAAAITAPLAAIALWAAGFRFPFPRIFDRTVMLTSFAALLVMARRLKPLDLLQPAFSSPKTGIWHVLGGLALASTAMAILFGLAGITGADIRCSIIARSVLRYLPAAVSIAVVEEAFFRAFLLSGIERDIGAPVALLASSAIYAMVHVIRSPARFYVTDFEPLAGAENLAVYAERMIRPEVGLALLGLFLLGLVMGEAFVATRRAYASVGLHAGFVLGAKTWRLAAGGPIPQWLAGPGSVPLIAAPAAWSLSMILITALHFWSRLDASFSGPRLPSQSSRANYAGTNADTARGRKSGPL
jgi:membrane protease YdiL (CAAX protease family)